MPLLNYTVINLPMIVTNLMGCTDTLVVTWADDTTSRFSTIWLRDNCPSGLHPETNERLLDLLAIDQIPVLISVELEDNIAFLV